MMMKATIVKPKILAIEDDDNIQLIIQSTLESQCDVMAAGSIQQGERLLASHSFDLILLDVILPDGNGFEFAQKLKKFPPSQSIPLIFLTGQASVENIVQGLKLGANDYISKPFHVEELLARVEVQLRHSEDAPCTLTYHAAESFTVKLNINSMQAVLCSHQKELRLDLTPIEFKLFKILCDNQGWVLSRQELIESAWGKNINILDRTVDRHISTLRKKLGPIKSQLSSVPGQGYRLSAGHGKTPYV